MKYSDRVEQLDTPRQVMAVAKSAPQRTLLTCPLNWKKLKVPMTALQILTWLPINIPEFICSCYVRAASCFTCWPIRTPRSNCANQDAWVVITSKRPNANSSHTAVWQAWTWTPPRKIVQNIRLIYSWPLWWFDFGGQGVDRKTKPIHYTSLHSIAGLRWREGSKIG